MENKLGVMQGRLSAPRGGKIQSFPLETWRDEFKKANLCGLDLIEWIFEAADWEKNPLLSDAGLAEMRQLSSQYHVGVLSVCADYFMDRPLIRATPSEKQERLDMLRRVIAQCAKANIQYLVIPYVDQSAINSTAELDETSRDMKAIAPLAKTHGVTLCLETSLAPCEFHKLLEETDSQIKVNYDIGNSASLGFNVAEEFNNYGPRIATIHIKDRKRAGTTVPLGTGDADFRSVFAECTRLNYQGPFILQAARQNDEVLAVKEYVRFARQWI